MFNYCSDVILPLDHVKNVILCAAKNGANSGVDGDEDEGDGEVYHVYPDSTAPGNVKGWAKKAQTIPEESIPDTQLAHVPAIQTPEAADRVYTGEEREALESLFQQMTLPDTQTSQTAPPSRRSAASESNLKERHSGLDLLSRRLRTRMSKESRLLKSKSKLSVKQQSEGPTGNPPSSLPGTSILPDILGSGPVSEGGYDSDAQGIMTPRTESSIAGSTRIPPENVNKTPNPGGKDLVDTAKSCALNILNPPTANTGFEPRVGLSSERLYSASNSGIPTPPRTPKINKAQFPSPRPMIKVLPRDGIATNAGSSSPGVSSARALRASEPTEPSESVSYTVPQRSSSSIVPASRRQLSSPHRNIGSTPRAFLKPLDVTCVSKTQNPDPSGSADPKNHQRDTSSMYGSHTGSLPPSPNSSMRYMPLSVPEELCSISTTTPLDGGKPDAPINATNSAENHSISPQIGEPTTPSSKSQDDMQNGTLPSPGGSGPGQSIQSRFTEELESPERRLPNTTGSLRRESHRSSVGSRSTSDGWLSGGRRQGYGYDFVSETEETNMMWERALKAHNEGESARGRERSHSSFNWAGKIRSLKSSRDSSENAAPEAPSTISVLPDKPSTPQNHGKIAAPGIGRVVSKKEGSDTNPTRSLHLWASFPSHSRDERCASAGATDNVIVRDFSSTQDQRPILESSFSSQVDGQMDVETPRKRGIEWFRQWPKISRRSSGDLRRYRAGHWASVSRGGRLKYPELELIPGGPTPYVHMEQLGNVEKASKRFFRRQKAKKTNQPDAEQPGTPEVENAVKPPPVPSSNLTSETETENQFVLAPLPPYTSDYEQNPSTETGETAGIELLAGDNSEMWSRLYADCVNRPTSDTGADALSLTSISSGAVVLPDGAQTQRLKVLSTSIDLNSSTVDFNEFQLADEARTRDSLMRMVEAVWGAGPPDTRIGGTS
ncbi:hypothetical protein FQN54_009560 [Arachnomyces sp. PD_36]|nr:hypothetical protein FQN54_009560 [Arachnomyces sp. PD_36]